MRKILMVIFLGFFLLGPNFLVHSAGFLIYEHGAAAMAMGGAFVALANNPSAIFHNPAGMAWLDGTQMSLGTTLITAKGSLSLPRWPDPNFKYINQVSQWFYPSTVYITHTFTDKVTAGFGFFSPYGLGTKWPEEYPLKYIATESDMETFFFNPAVSYKFNENFSMAFGVSYVYSTLDFKLIELVDLSAYGLGAYDVPVAFDASGGGWGFNAGALYKGEGFSLGFNWRSGFKIKYEGDLEIDASKVPIPGLPTSGGASTTFSFPHILGVGAVFYFTEKLIFSADLHFVLWSCFDELLVEVEVPGFEDKELEEDWRDSYCLRGGFQYTLNKSIALRGGIIFFDKTPQPKKAMDPILPDSDRTCFTGGVGYKSGNFALDVAYQFEIFTDRKSPNREILIHPLANFGEGTYSTNAHLIGISLGFVF